MSAPNVVLNSDFIPVYYNGGVMYGSTGVYNTINHDIHADEHYSYDGSNFDLILKYEKDEPFTLSHLTFHPNSGGNAWLKNVAIWVHPATEDGSLPDISYSSKFDDTTPERYFGTQEELRSKPTPDAFVTLAKTRDTAVALKAPKAGKYVHIKFIDAYGSNSTNIDIGKIFLVGKQGKHADMAVVDATEEAINVSTSTGQNWSFMFNTPASAISKVSPEDRAMLLSLNTLKHVAKLTELNKLHADFEDVINSSDVVVFLTNTNIDEAKAAVAAGTATEEQTKVVSAYLALQSVARLNTDKSGIFYFVVDPTVSATTLRPLLQYISLPHASIKKDTPFTVTLPSSLTEPFAIVAVIDSGDKYYFHEQDISALETALVKAKKVMKDTKKAGAKKSADEELSEAIASLSLEDSSVKASAAQVSTFVEALKASSDPRASKLVTLKKHQACQTLTSDTDKNYPFIKIANLATFNELVIDSDRPVVCFFTGDDCGTAFASSLYATASVFNRYDVEVDFVAVDQTLNDLDTALYPDPNVGVVRVYTKNEPAKSTKKGASAIAPNQFPVTLKNKNGKLIKAFDLPLDTKGDDENEDDEEEEDKEDDKVTVPHLSVIVDFISEYVKVPETEVFKKDIATTGDAIAVGDAIISLSAIVLSDLASVGVGPELHFRLAEDSPVAKAVVEINTIRKQVTSILESIPAPLGLRMDDSEVPAVAFDDVKETLLDLNKAFFAAVDVVVTYTINTKNARVLAYKAGRFLTAFGDALKEKATPEQIEDLTKTHDTLVSLVGEYVPSSANLPPASIKVTSDDKAVVVSADAVADAIVAADKAVAAVEAFVTETIADADAESEFDMNVVNLETPEHLQRMLFGHKHVHGPPAAPKRAGRNAKKDVDPVVDNAAERLVVLFFTSDWDISWEYRSEIADAARLAKEAEEDGEAGVVYGRISVESGENGLYETVKRFFNITDFPTLCVFQSGVEIPSLRMEGATKENHDNFIKMVTSSEDNEDEMEEDMEDMEEDMGMEYMEDEDMEDGFFFDEDMEDEDEDEDMEDDVAVEGLD